MNALRFSLFIPAVFLVGTLTSMHAQRNNLHRVEDYTHLRGVFGLGLSNKVTVLSKFGSIEVTGADTDTVSAEVQTIVEADTEEKARKSHEWLKVGMLTSFFTGITIESDFEKLESVPNRSFQINMKISVPRWVKLKIENKFGDIRVSGVSGSVRIDGKYGEITVAHSANVEIENAFGAIMLNSIRGDCRVEGKNGKIRAYNIEGGEFDNAYGAVEISGAQQPVTVDSKMGSVELKDLAGGKITSNYGSVDVWLKQSFTGRIEAKTAVGVVKSDVPLQPREKATRKYHSPERHDMVGSIGSGTALLIIDTRFGDVTIRK